METAKSRKVRRVAPPLSKRLFTADLLLELPINWRYELVEGHLVPMAPTGDPHGYYTADLTIEIGYFVRTQRLGRCYAAKTGFLLAQNPDTVLAPDFAFVAQGRLAGPPSQGYVPVAPDLVLETRSPSDRPAKVAVKIEQWLTAGARLVMDMQPAERAIIVYRPNVPAITLTTADTLEGYDVLPGFSLPLSCLFTDAV